MQENYLRAIKTFEGFHSRAKWDYAQHTNGFGTRALFAGEKIDEAEANRRFASEIEQARQFVEHHAAGWDDGTKAALTSLTFNAGTRWASSGLGDAVRAGNVDGVKAKFLTYTRAGGVDLPGLIKRRLEEATWIGNPPTSVTNIAGSARLTEVEPAGSRDEDGKSAASLTQSMPSFAPAPTPMVVPNSIASKLMADSLVMLMIEIAIARADDPSKSRGEAVDGGPFSRS